MSNKQKSVLLSTATILLWGMAFPVTKIAQGHFSTYPLGFFRCLTGAVALLLMGKFFNLRAPKIKDIPILFLSGALGFSVYLIAFNTGLLTLTAATSSIVIAITPILTAIVASFLFKEKINTIGWISIACAFVGVLVLMLWEGVLSINIGLIWTLGAAIVFCGYNILSRHLLKRGFTSYEITTYSMLTGAIMFSFCIKGGITELQTSSAIHVGAILFLAILPSALGFVLWGKAMLLVERTSEVTNFMFVTPLVSTVFGFILLKEVPNLGTFVGGGIIIASIVVFNLKGKGTPVPVTPVEITES